MGINGIANLLKPPGMTSHDVVGVMRRLTGIKKIGHTGTLDPMATGVLPICIGKATRIIEYMESDTKLYRCEMILGVETDTQDIWGTVLRHDTEAAAALSESRIYETIIAMQGKQEQLPPKYSAIKVNGKRLYEYARKGEDVEIKSRQIEIFDIKPIRFDTRSMRVTFDVHCSKGTYVRTICTDIGNKLNCGAAMSFLSRMTTGMFHLKDSVTIEDIEKNGVERYLYDMDYPLAHLPEISILEAAKEKFSNGIKLDMNDLSAPLTANDGDVCRVYCDDIFLGTAIYDGINDFIAAEKVLCK